MPSTVTPGLLAQVTTGIQGRFMRGLENADVFYPKVSMVTGSNTHTEVYPFLGNIPALEEWVGERQSKGLKAYDFAIKNRHFEATLKVNRDQVEDNQLGGFYPMAELLGRRAAQHPDELISALIEGGFTGISYDGSTFFSTTHPVGSATASNRTTSALDATSYAAARAAMMNFTDDQGKKLNIRPNLLIVPPALETTGRLLLNADFISVSSGSTQNNVWKGSADLLVVPQLTDATNWYLLDTSAGIPPFILQVRKQAQIVPRTNMSDDNLFWQNEFVYGVDWRGEAGYGAWQAAYGAIVAG